MLDAKETMTSTFKELRLFLRESPKGAVFDSLIAVELGLDQYETFWAAHCDMYEGLIFEDLVIGFLTDIYEMIGDGADIDDLVSQVADD
jgi:hypothetical protein